MNKKRIDCDDINLTSDSYGDTDPGESGASDDIIYVDLTKDPESQDWLSQPIKGRKKFDERSDEHREQIKNQFQTMVEELDD